jgi:flagellum-specific ATP synthase
MEKRLNHRLHLLQPIERLGEIEQCIGMNVVSNGPAQVFVGELCDILDTHNKIIMQAEVVGFERGKVYLMPFSKAHISMGFKVRATGQGIRISLGIELLGRVVNAFGEPLDEGMRLRGTQHAPLHYRKINPLHRQTIIDRLTTGIQAIDSLLPIGKGQRIGLFAGSGVGKSVLLGMMAKHISSDINVIALIGERGREVNDFINTHLDKQTRQKSVVVVACSDDFALMRKQAVYTATAIAEYFCEQGRDVMLFMDSITRFAMAQREIGLGLGEPPTARGYTPSVFSILPGIVERAGNFTGKGSITALYTVLVEGDDFNEPIADTMRSLLDGHIVLTRELAHRGHYPAIDVLQSVSRLAHQLTTPEEQQLIKQVIALLSLYQQNKDLIELGAYQPGNNEKLDYAVARIDAVQSLLTQTMHQSLSTTTVNQQLREIIQ